MALIAFIALAPSPLEKTKLASNINPEAKTAALEPVSASKTDTKPLAPIQPEKPAEPAPVAVPAPSDCASQLGKYDWPQDVAYRVMMKESTNFPGNLNNTPATGDYSVGCFQINLYGRNALTRPSEAWLKVAENNVAYAYKLWSGTRSFYGHWPNTCRAVGC